MQRTRIGELLGQIVPLTIHDVEEILQEQSSTHQRFGEIALAWGLCQPEHVWNAWCSQLAKGIEHVDLKEVGVDSQAITLIPLEIVHILIVATSAEEPAPLASQLIRRLHRKVILVRADCSQLHEMIDRYYPARQMAS